MAISFVNIAKGEVFVEYKDTQPVFTKLKNLPTSALTHFPWAYRTKEIIWQNILNVKQDASPEHIIKTAGRLKSRIELDEGLSQANKKMAHEIIDLAVQAGTGKLTPCRVYDGDRELPHVDLKTLATLDTIPQDKDRHQYIPNGEALIKSWKRGAMAQAAVTAVMGMIWAKNYINDDDMVAFKKSRFGKMIYPLMKYPTGSALLSLTMLGVACYPLYNSGHLFSIGAMLQDYPHAIVEKNIVVFRRLKAIYNPRQIPAFTLHTSEPLAYMSLDEFDKEFEIVHRAKKFAFTTLVTSIVLLYSNVIKIMVETGR